MYQYITKSNYHILHIHQLSRIAYTQLSHITKCDSNANHVTQCMWYQCEPKVSPLSDSLSRIQATPPIRTRSRPPTWTYSSPLLFPFKDQSQQSLYHPTGLRSTQQSLYHPTGLRSTIMNACTINTTYAIKIISSILTYRILQ